MITGNQCVIPDARVRNIISKGPKYRFPSSVDFSKCRREIAASLNDSISCWCKREYVEPDALKERRINIFKIIDTHISFYSRNTYLFPTKPKSSFHHLKRGIQDFHMNYVLVPADKLLTMLYLFDDCIILILLSVSWFTLIPINCSLL